MSKRGFVITLLSIFVALPFGACNQKSKNAANPSPASTSQASTTNADRALKQQTADAENRTNAELNDWDQRIDQFKNEQKHVKSKARKDQWKEAVSDLENKRDTRKAPLG